MTELIICEKPSAAAKIASALGNTKPVKRTNKKAIYYEITHGKTDIIVGCAVGVNTAHLGRSVIGIGLHSQDRYHLRETIEQTGHGWTWLQPAAQQDAGYAGIALGLVGLQCAEDDVAAVT